jgi:purine-cytosine permease-like protein
MSKFLFIVIVGLVTTMIALVGIALIRTFSTYYSKKK